MKWLKRRLIKWLRETDLEIREISPKTDYTLSYAKGIRFTVYPARSGMVVEAMPFDNHSNKINPSELYIINHDQNLSEELGKIITLQGLK